MSSSSNPKEEQQKVVNGMLIGAVGANDFARIDLCLQKGADINTKDAYGRTPLILAVSYKRPPLIEFLLKKNPDLFATDTDGKTAFDHAAEITDWTSSNKIKEILLQALPDKPPPSSTPKNDNDPAADPMALAEDLKISKPVQFAPKKKPTGFHL